MDGVSVEHLLAELRRLHAAFARFGVSAEAAPAQSTALRVRRIASDDDDDDEQHTNDDDGEPSSREWRPHGENISSPCATECTEAFSKLHTTS